MTHRGRRSEYGAERWLVRQTARFDRQRGELTARETFGMKYFEDGQVLVSPRGDGTLQKVKDPNDDD